MSDKIPYERFITLESGDGAGKTTALNTIVEVFEKRNIPYIVTQEPGSTELGRHARKIAEQMAAELSPRAEMHLFLMDREQHLFEKIVPALKNGKYVISSRFADSSIAYQGFGLEIDDAITLNEAILKRHQPGLTLWLNARPEVGLARITGEKDAIESRALDFHERLYEGFRALKEANSERYREIDASQPINLVQNAVRNTLETYLDSIEAKLS